MKPGSLLPGAPTGSGLQGVSATGWSVGITRAVSHTRVSCCWSLARVARGRPAPRPPNLCPAPAPQAGRVREGPGRVPGDQETGFPPLLLRVLGRPPGHSLQRQRPRGGRRPALPAPGQPWGCGGVSPVPASPPRGRPHQKPPGARPWHGDRRLTVAPAFYLLGLGFLIREVGLIPGAERDSFLRCSLTRCPPPPSIKPGPGREGKVAPGCSDRGQVT